MFLKSILVILPEDRIVAASSPEEVSTGYVFKCRRQGGTEEMGSTEMSSTASQSPSAQPPTTIRSAGWRERKKF